MANEKKQGLEVGEPYFTLSADAEKLLGKAMRAIQNGHKNVYISMFPNKHKQEKSDPVMHAADNIGAVWKQKKKENKRDEGEDEVDVDVVNL